MRSRLPFLAAVLSLAAAWPIPAAAELRLVMVEEPGCLWCARWNSEIGPIYPKTDEGALAPLQRLDKSSAELKALDLERPVIYTPTFVLMDDDDEIGRIEGYPGEDFFWGLLAAELAKVSGEPPGN